MNGIFSSTPGTGAIRLLVGTHGLLVSQAVIALTAPDVATSFRVVVVLVLALALGGLVGAALGLPESDGEPWRHRRGR